MDTTLALAPPMTGRAHPRVRATKGAPRLNPFVASPRHEAAPPPRCVASASDLRSVGATGLDRAAAWITEPFLTRLIRALGVVLVGGVGVVLGAQFDGSVPDDVFLIALLGVFVCGMALFVAGLCGVEMRRGQA